MVLVVVVVVVVVCGCWLGWIDGGRAGSADWILPCLTLGRCRIGMLARVGRGLVVGFWRGGGLTSLDTHTHTHTHADRGQLS